MKELKMETSAVARTILELSMMESKLGKKNTDFEEIRREKDLKRQERQRMGDLAIEKLQLEVAQLKVEVVTKALQKLKDS
ncbi:hypothetical protein LINPERHAP1_LOCUS30865 [Linum perenne]